MSEEENLLQNVSPPRPKPRELSLSDILNPANETDQSVENKLNQHQKAEEQELSKLTSTENEKQPAFWRPYRSRGSLKIFLGAAAGVGKTYAMLEEARYLKAQGIDVVIGYVELHGRKETETLLEGFEVIPRQQIEYRGTILEEMDTTAVIARQPQLVLVDELAHTNPPGANHEKRYEDIEEILASGIDVYSTVNVQHLESLNDRVFELTKTRVRETFPDRILELADNVVLIDLPPEELRERIRQGKVYKPEKVYQALNNFFKTNNLLILRELALRETADAVNISSTKRSNIEVSEDEPATLQGIVLICVTFKAQDAGVIRKGWRFAHRLNVPAEVVTVWVDDDRKASQEATIAPLRRLTHSLRVPFIELSGDPVEMIVREAQVKRATLIVLGESTRDTWKERLFGSFTDKILRKLDSVDIYIVGSAAHPNY